MQETETTLSIDTLSRKRWGLSGHRLTGRERALRSRRLGPEVIPRSLKDGPTSRLPTQRMLTGAVDSRTHSLKRKPSCTVGGNVN